MSEVFNLVVKKGIGENKMVVAGVCCLSTMHILKIDDRGMRSMS